MKARTRLILGLVNAALCIILVWVRQYGQMSFIQLQDIAHQQKVEQYMLNQKHVDYLRVLSDVPRRAMDEKYDIRGV